MECFVALLLAMTNGEVWSEKLQLLRATTPRDDGVFDRQEQSAGHVYFSAQRSGERLAETNGVLEGRGDVNGGVRIGLAYRCGDVSGIGTLVVRLCADDDVEGQRQRVHDFVGVLVERDADHKNPLPFAMDCLEAGKRLPDAVGGVTDVDDGERVLPNSLEASRPARFAQARSHRGFDFARRISRSRAALPEQEQSDRDRGIVQLKRAPQARFKETKIVISELEVKPLP